MMTMDRKVALVTGGTSGIGLAIAGQVLELGANVVIAGRNIQRGQAAIARLDAGGRCRFVPTDVSLPEQVTALVRDTLGAFGRLDIAFNNAASLIGGPRRLADETEETWEANMTVNLRSVWLCMRAEIRQMLAQGDGGAIVNTASVNGLGAAPMAGLYSVTKAGVIALTKSAAIDYAPDKIRVNALVAGAFDTPMLRGALKKMEGPGRTPDQIEAMYTQRIPLARIGDPEEAATAAVWLGSDAASYVTGHSMIVDGGLTSFAR